MYTTVAVQWDVCLFRAYGRYMVKVWEIKVAVSCFVKYVCTNVGYVCMLHYQCGGTFMCSVAGYFSGAYANNLKCMYTSVHSHIVDCRDFIKTFIVTYLSHKFT